MRALRVLTASLLLVLGSAATAVAQDEPPPVRRSSGGGGGGSISFPSSAAGSQGLRPFIGVLGDLGIDEDSNVDGGKFMFGLDYLLGNPNQGVGYGLGLHMGAGRGGFLLYPLFEVHYRFPTNIPLKPWIGGGGGIRLGFGRRSTALALSFRFVGGVDFFFSQTIGVGMQLALPDVGPRLAPSVAPVASVEWIIGPHFRL